MEEIWKKISEFPNYYISSDGNIKGKRGFLKAHYSGKNVSVSLLHNKKYYRKRVNYLVAKEFTTNPMNYVYIKHIDGNYHNNNYLNLKYVKNKQCESRNGTLLQKFPELLKDWKFENGEMEDYSPFSTQKVDWKCSKCGHEWSTQIYSRTKQRCGCPSCSGQIPNNENNLFLFCKTNNITLIREWDDSNLMKSFLPFSNRKARWKCSECNYKWSAVIYSRVGGAGCPSCTGKIPSDKYNLLYYATINNPILLREWNDSRSMSKFTHGSKNIVEWKCSKNINHGVWKTTINSRTQGTGCPYCSHKKVIKDESVGILFPCLIQEWNDDENPYSVSRGSHKKIGWKCNKCNYEWNSTIYHRTSGKGCPKCRRSHQERKLEQFLLNNNYIFEIEYTFDDCLGLSNRLRFDFMVNIDSKIFILVEINGKQHYEPCKFFGGVKQFEKQQKYDKIKDDYCKSKNIPFLRIKYDEDVVTEFTKFVSTL